MFCGTKDVAVTREADVQSDRFWATGLGISVAAERLIPPCALIFGSRLVLLDLFTFGGLRLLNLSTPMFQVHEAAIVELDLCLAIPLELESEGRMGDDNFELALRAVHNFGQAVVCLTDGSTGADLGTADNRPLLSLIVSFLPGLAAMSKFDLALLAFLLVHCHTCDARFQESDSEWEAYIFGRRQSLEDGASQNSLLNRK